jgi:hypothetical protein
VSQKWQPWLDHEPSDKRQVFAAELEISAPPCPDCWFWAPRRIYSHGKYDGVVLCHADERYGDFSCYKPRDGGSP